MTDEAALRTVKSLHTVVWAFLVACIIGAPIAAARGQFTLAGVLVGLVVVEGLVLLANSWACPLTTVASRYTERREENFDIYLPRWLAKHNKIIFTPLFVVGAAYVAVEWWRHG